MYFNKNIVFFLKEDKENVFFLNSCVNNAKVYFVEFWFWDL